MSTLAVNTIQAQTGTTVSVASGQTLHAPGHVIQVVEGAVTGSSSTQSTSYIDTGLSASITPKFTSSKILVRMDAYAYNSVSGYNNFLMLVRGTTPIGHGGAGNTDNDNASAFAIAHCGLDGRDGSFSVSVLDSPTTTSATTYKIRFRSEAGSDTAYFNYIANTTTRPRSTLTLMEIAQ